MWLLHGMRHQPGLLVTVLLRMTNKDKTRIRDEETGPILAD